MKKYVLILSLFGLIGSACSSKLDIVPPNSVTDEQVMQYKATALKPAVANLAPLVNGKNFTVVYHDWHATNLTQSLRANDLVYKFGSGQGWNKDEYRLKDFRAETAGNHQYFWNWMYEVVFNANTVNDLIGDIPMSIDANLTADEKKDLQAVMGYKASALTLRAFAYYYLVMVYSDTYAYTQGNKEVLGVPLKLDADIWAKPLGRAKLSEVWKTIETDLKNSLTWFAQSNIGKNGFTPETNDIDISVANFILARVAIASGNNELAVEAADRVIEKYPSFITAANYVGSPVIENGKMKSFDGNAFTNLGMAKEEVVMGFPSGEWLSKAPGNIVPNSSFIGWMNIFGDGGYGGSATGFMAIDNRLWKQLDANDVRGKNFLTEELTHTYEAAKVTRTLEPGFNLKFGTLKGGKENNKQDIIVMRSSEMHLIKAEALYKLGDEDGAKAALGLLTAARNASSVTESGDALFQRIRLENRIELWCENGSEYYNNKRWNIGVDRISDEAGITSSHVDADARIQRIPSQVFVWQIPLPEMNYNNNIAGQQNPY